MPKMLNWIRGGLLAALGVTQACAGETPPCAASAAAPANYSAPWLNQIALPATTTTSAKGGQGVVIAIVDTGIAAGNAEFAGRVSSLSSCAAVSFACSAGAADDNGHGSAVAAIAAGAYSGAAAPMSGVAPGVTIVAIKAMSRAGSGYESDIANGLMKAADSGASVINLSLTYAPTLRIAAAMQYAALKGAVIVFAAGNEGVDLSGGGVLSQTTLSHLILVGSVNSANVKSSFSNTPGAATVTAAASGASPARTVGYQTLWIMAPGEEIVAPSVTAGPTALASWSGTSMAAPVVTGAVALLQKTWPVLTRNGAAPAVLIASATDLGATGPDAVYGSGLLNLTRAFAPIGALSAVSPTGASVALGANSAATLSSGALGSLKSLGSALANYTVFDGYSRNFSANLSTLITRPPGAAVSLSSLVYSPVWTNALRLSNGGQLRVYGDTLAARTPDQLDPSPYGLTGAPPRPPVSYLAYVTPRGLSVAGGYGLGASGFFDGALWGSDAVATLDVGGVSRLAEGGYSASLGVPVTGGLRVAAGWTETPDLASPLAKLGPGARTARAASLGLALQDHGPVAIGVKLSALDETSGLLGASYGPTSALSFGRGGMTYALDLSAAIDLGAGRRLALTVVEAQTPRRAVTQGLISQVSRLDSQGFGAALTLPGVVVKGDRLTLGVSQLLRLRAGSVTLAQTDVDADGYAHTRGVDVPLKGGAPRTDVSVAYARQLGRSTLLQADLTWRDHPPQAASDLAVRAVIQTRF